MAPRHDFESLPISSEIEVRCAQQAELPALAEMAHRVVPGVEIAQPALARYLSFDSECIFTFRRKEQLLGAIAFLYLNSRGHDALLLDKITLTHPEIDLLSGSGQEVSAIYVWAIAATGRGILGLGNVTEYLRRPRFFRADYYAQPSTRAGRDLLIATGFRQIPSFQPDLWCYERPWNRASVTPSGVSTRRFADAWH